jgi:uncharacterized protein (DUF697 family)
MVVTLGKVYGIEITAANAKDLVTQARGLRQRGDTKSALARSLPVRTSNLLRVGDTRGPGAC